MKIRFLLLIAFLQLINVSYFSCVYAARPPWTKNQPDGYFCGRSSGHMDSDSAINYAVLDVKKQILRELGERVESVEKISLTAKTVASGDQKEDSTIEIYDEKTTSTGKAILHLTIKDKYTESYREKGKKKYKAWVLVPFSSADYWADKRRILNSLKTRIAALNEQKPLAKINSIEEIIKQAEELLEICEYKTSLKGDIGNFVSLTKGRLSGEFNTLRIRWEPSLDTLLLCEGKNFFAGNIFLLYNSKPVENSFEILRAKPASVCRIDPGDKKQSVFCGPFCFPVKNIDLLIGAKIGGKYLEKRIIVPVEKVSTEVKIEHTKKEAETINPLIKQKLFENGLSLEQDDYEKKIILTIRSDFDRIDSYGALKWVRLNVEQSLIFNNQSVSTKNFSSKGAGKNVSSALKNAFMKMEKIGKF